MPAAFLIFSIIYKEIDARLETCKCKFWFHKWQGIR